MALTIKDYEERISKAEDRLAKIEKRINKWEEAKTDEKFIKHYDWLKADAGWQLGWDNVTGSMKYGSFEQFKENRYPEYLEEIEREIRIANRDREDVLVLIDKYKNNLELLKEKESRPVIQIFKDFFDNWKKEIIEYVRPLLDEYYKLHRQAVELINNRNNFSAYGFSTKEELEDAYNNLKEAEREIKGETFVAIAIDKRFKWDEKPFNEYLDDYMNKRYFELVDKVTKITGQIEDVSMLKVGYDGSLNGRVYGDKGGAKIETIIAGGYNANVIVNVKRGQIRHYRVLVHPIK